MVQKIRDVERQSVFDEFSSKIGEIIVGNVYQIQRDQIFVHTSGGAEFVLPKSQQLPNDRFRRGESIRGIILNVELSNKGPEIIISRSDDLFLKRLFEKEIPEIEDDIIEIKGVSRSPGDRSKVVVYSSDPRIDAVGACVGMRGMRVQSIVQELRGEKIDIVEHSEDAEEYARRALSPAKISRIIMNHKEQQMTIIVADDQMSLAIGKKGQNVKLAAKLVNWQIDIKGETETRALLELTSPFRKTVPGEKAFFEAIDACEELDETVAPALLENKVRTFNRSSAEASTLARTALTALR